MCPLSNCCQVESDPDIRMCSKCKEHCQIVHEEPCELCGGNVDHHSSASNYYFKETGQLACQDCLERLDAKFDAVADYQGE